MRAAAFHLMFQLKAGQFRMDERTEASTKANWLPVGIGVLAAISIAGVGLACYDASQLQVAQQVSNELKTAEQSTIERVATLEQRLTKADAANAQLQSDLGVVTTKLRLTQADLKKARDEAAQVAAQVRDDDAQKLAQLDTDVKAQLATKPAAMT
jgi:DNA anti-recombination protein RmuC